MRSCILQNTFKKNSEEMAFKSGTCLAFFFLLASLAVIITISVIQGHKRIFESRLKYGIVIDSGSSRSTVYLYQWPAEKENNTGVVTQRLRCSVAGPGISDMLVDPARDKLSWTSIRECMNNVTKIVPAAQHNSTILYLGATAGMRLLHSQNETMSNEILGNLQNYLQSLPFNYQNASIMSGDEEGLYGWITVNYLMGNFLEKNIWNTWVRPAGGKMVGSMDLGGASTQIAFTLPDPTARGTDIVQVSLYGYEYNIYTHSFLCYGKNEAEKRVLATLVKNSKNATHVINPCFGRGYNTTVAAESIFGTQCTELPTNYDPKQMITLVGSSDNVACRDVVHGIFDLTSCTDNCSFDGVYQPPVGSGDFLAYAGYFYTAQAIGLTSISQLDQWNSTTWEFCSWDWPTLKLKKSWISDIYLKSYCYSAHYVQTILVNGYKFNKDTWKNIDFQKQVHNTSVGWSLGYMLHTSNMIPAEAKLVRLPMANSVFGGLLFLFTALTIVSVMFLIIKAVRACY
ncbi:ectonucleoside triphosphate diphosphohydrolase 3 [Esox lucius]|uniref:Ectonucleoside triphosphate diphosphohydrolase 3 n=1 Tax=Esox lucius TaxID=8010 RepID=A0A3P8XPB2_ESOLU|nr:ectonucleoside triphosphate diphosphohydrolase 3 [Esox lucius]